VDIARSGRNKFRGPQPNNLKEGVKWSEGKRDVWTKDADLGNGTKAREAQ